MEIRGQLVGVGSLLLPRRFQGINSGCQAWWQALIVPDPPLCTHQYFRYQYSTHPGGYNEDSNEMDGNSAQKQCPEISQLCFVIMANLCCQFGWIWYQTKDILHTGLTGYFLERLMEWGRLSPRVDSTFWRWPGYKEA